MHSTTITLVMYIFIKNIEILIHNLKNWLNKIILEYMFVFF